MSQRGNNREMTTSPPGHHREEIIALTTAAKLQQLRANSHEMTTFAESCNNCESNDRDVTSQKLNNRHLSCMTFCFALLLLSFQVPFGSL